LGRGLQNRQHHTGFLVVALAFVALAAPAAARAWTWPVQGPVLQSFDFDELNPKAPGQHRGISIGSPTGTPVLSPVDATVTFAGSVPSGGKTLSLLTA
jgi:murein DD-endopeptidase MepM/ murein hydrolase activator NlpD